MITIFNTSDTISTHSLTFPDTNSADITILSKNVVLQSDLKGRWELPDSSSVADSRIQFELYTKDLAGLYNFYVTSWDRSEVIAIQIELSAIGRSHLIIKTILNACYLYYQYLISRLQLCCNNITRRMQHIIW